ncbi:mechanosensitive ion channel [Photobacterium sp. ZSDE20]|uniref:Mechanosensitive ion channel n=1 Tax=Photobacterium pectinilyticum TaxID=2906793 RepID=A0ABT1N3J5_9GAMM|nr:mechanosensitive ion channel domain-containing protein [Photobacterium sp. ZSDE20]MCQ1059325.1 mechanosensitive ion channel [Photobacterium sp. ZSDE20]MDD1825584.1 mechanosensitive ion channel [Photobacterium sp. ZSDE20]
MWSLARKLIFCLGLSLLLTAGLGAQTLPDIDYVDSEIERLNTESPKDEDLIQQYQSLAQSLKSQKTLADERERLRSLITQFPQQRALLSKKVKDADLLPVFQTDHLESYDDLSQALARLSASLSEWQTASKANADKRKKLNDSRNTLPKEIASLNSQLDQASLTVSDSTDKLRVWLATANSATLQLEKDKKLLEQQTLDERSELLQLEKALLAKKIELAIPLQIQLQNRLTAIEQGSAKALIAKVEQNNRALLDNKMPEAEKDISRQEQAAKLLALAKELERVLLEVDDARVDIHRIQVERQSLTDEQVLIKNNLDWLSESTSFGASIRAQLQRLPTRVAVNVIPDQIAKAHIRKYEISQLRSDVMLNEQARDQSVDNPDGEGLLELQRKDLNKKLLSRLSQEYDKLITELSRLQAASIQYKDEVNSARSFLREQQLWIRSNLPLWKNLTRFEMDVWFGAHTPLKVLFERTSQQQQMTLVFSIAGYTLLFFLLRMKLSRLSDQHRLEYKSLFGHPLKDKFRYTLILFALALFRAVVWPLWYGLTALGIFWLWPQPTSGDLPSLITTSAWGLFVLELIQSLTAKDGVLDLHLNWPSEICRYLHRESRRLRWPLIIILLALYCSELVSGEKEAEASRVLFLLLVSCMTYIYAFLFKRERLPMVLPSPLHQGFPLMLIRGLVIGSFFAIMLMSVLGLYLASWVLLHYQQLTLFLMLGVLLVYQMGERWLKLEHRQLSYQRLLERREELIAQQQEQAGEPPELAELREVMPEVEENSLNAEQVSEQSLTLLRGLSLIGLVIAMLTLWSSALEMTSWLGKVVVWQVSEVGETGAVMVDITLRSLIDALITLLVTFIAVRNLPGILELLVLRRLDLSPGTGYAATTVLRYLVMLIGVFSACSLIGFQWSSLQWLVAAFGVGLGFGLQEIFANFISGLIILFERPIRIGDIVTINDLSGTVSKIKTRATTITDWDNKEIVVPNKAFITEKLINWSLTDPITRIVIPIGVAYGSDIEKVETLLYQVANEHPLVLKDPPPSVFFLAFGASSLDFELRVYITAIDLRLSTIHLINKSIDSLFRQNDIEIAFPQMDIHVRDVKQEKDNPPSD